MVNLLNKIYIYLFCYLFVLYMKYLIYIYHNIYMVDMVGDCDCDIKVNDADGTSDVDHAGGCAWTELSYANAMVW